MNNYYGDWDEIAYAKAWEAQKYGAFRKFRNNQPPKDLSAKRKRKRKLQKAARRTNRG